MATAYISHPDCLLHDMGEYHPERPARLRAIDDRLIASGLMDLLRPITAQPATREQIERVHSPRYVAELEQKRPRQGLVMLDPDTWMNPHTWDAALLAAGAAAQAVDRVMAQEVENAFCAIRPPGHHAERDHAMGFCFFNNVAVAAAHALARHGLERIAILDFDVHHGNGTEDIVADDPRILLCSTFQHPFYPFTDIVHRPSNVVHAPLPSGAGSSQFREAVGERWLPALSAFRPQFILISAGFDGHVEDDMAGLRLVDDDYGWITKEILRVADRHAHRRVVSVLEGGYALDALGRSAAAHIRALMRI